MPRSAEIRDFGQIFSPGDVLKLEEDSLDDWRPYIEHRALRRFPSKAKAEEAALSALELEVD